MLFHSSALFLRYEVLDFPQSILQDLVLRIGVSANMLQNFLGAADLNNYFSSQFLFSITTSTLAGEEVFESVTQCREVIIELTLACGQVWIDQDRRFWPCDLKGPSFLPHNVTARIHHL